MFDRNTFRQLELLFAPAGTAQERIARQVSGLLLLLRVIIGLLGPVKALWDNSFVTRLTGVDGGQIVNGLTVRQWHQYQAAFLVYAIFMKMPLVALAALELPDGTHPFAVFNVDDLQGMQIMSLEQIAFSEPDSTPPVTEVVEEPISEGEI